MKFIFGTLLIGSASFMYGQVGINTSSPTTSLDVVAKNATGTSTNVDGLLAPRVDRARAQSMTGVPLGTMIYINDVSTGTATGQTANVSTTGYYYFEGGVWVRLATPISVASTAWNTTGNAGTTPGTNYVGTSDNQNLIFKRNNVQAGMLTTSNTAFGVSSIPTAATGADNLALGAGTLPVLTTGASNAALGTSSLNTLTTGSRNIGIGLNTGRGITTGTSNIALGVNSLSSTTAAAIQRNIAIGESALAANNGGSSNVAIGVGSASGLTSGASNTLIGDAAGGTTLTTGSTNTVIGSTAGSALTTGSNNVILGAAAGSNITTGGTNIAIGNNSQIPTATASNQMNIGNAIFGTGMTGTLAAPAGNIGIGTSTPARRLEVNAAAAPIRVSNLQAIATASPNTTVPLILDTATGDIYQGRPSEMLIFNTNTIPNATPVVVNVTATATATGNSTQSIYNTTFTLVRPAIVTIFNSTSTSFGLVGGGVISDGTPRLSYTWVRISDSTGATIIQDSMGLASVSHNNTLSTTQNLVGNYRSASAPMLQLPAGTYRLDIFSLVGCSSGQNVSVSYGTGNDNLYVKADYF
ncbi:beta strand repeat-containing protein [Chryseobacterium sp. MMS23-Vi53]|uniref:beta strand repeat-containing protein n=1 Tax=Chryseobacterium sp. MMS23-Vi53 TaxID=3386644 RepID=UPI0039ED5020